MRFATIVFVLVAFVPDLEAGVLKVPQQFPTIQAAVNQAQPGDVIKIAKGKYPENVLIANKVDLELKAAGKVVVKPASGIPIDVDDSSGIVLQSLRVKSTGDSRGILIQASSNCVVRKCRVTSLGTGIGIYVSASSDVSVERNVLRGTPSSGVSLSSATDCRVEENDVKGATTNGVSVIGTGNSIADNVFDGGHTGGLLRELATEGNLVAGNTVRGQDDRGIFLNSEVSGNTVLENVVVKQSGKGIETEGDATLVLGNRVRKAGLSGIRVHGASSATHLAYNDVREAALYGFEVNADGTGVHGNVARKCGAAGIAVGGDGILVMANVAQQNAGFDLYEVPGVQDVIYADNEFGTFGP